MYAKHNVTDLFVKRIPLIRTPGYTENELGRYFKVISVRENLGEFDFWLANNPKTHQRKKEGETDKDTVGRLCYRNPESHLYWLRLTDTERMVEFGNDNRVRTLKFRINEINHQKITKTAFSFHMKMQLPRKRYNLGEEFDVVVVNGDCCNDMYIKPQSELVEEAARHKQMQENYGEIL